MKILKKTLTVLTVIASLVLGKANAQPVLMKVIPTGSTNFTTTEGRLFFTSGDSLWTSNGTAASTYFIKKTGEPFLNVTNLRLGTFIFFTTQQSDGKTALWRTNGTAVNTTKIAAYPTINPLIVYNGALYLGINDGVTGYELWRLNLSNVLNIVKDINTGAGDGLANNIIISSGTLYFPAFGGPGGFNIWKSTGSTASTVMAVDLPFTAFGLDLTDVNGTIFFSNEYTIGFTNYGELWKSNGTTAGTSIIKSYSDDFVTFQFSQLMEYKDKLYYYFIENTGVDFVSLWSSDGTTAGTVEIKHNIFVDIALSPIFVTNNTLVMTASSLFQLPLKKSDGTGPGTVNFYTYSDFFYGSVLESTDKLFFFTDNATVGGVETFDEIYQTDLTTENSTSLRELYGTSFAGSSNIRNAEGNIYFTTRLAFSSNPEERKMRLWFYNPTKPSTNVPYFTLVNATTNQDIAWLHNNDYIFKPDTLQINVRWNPTTTPGSVVFHLNSIPYRTENTAPFSLAGDTDGDYNPWPVTTGNYNISATPYSQPSGTGTPGPVSNVFVYVISTPPLRSADAGYDINNTSSTEAAGFEAYPNPSSDNFSFSVLNNENGIAKAEIYKADGTLVEKLLEANVAEGETIQFTWNGSQYLQGVYICKYTSGKKQFIKKIVLTK
ncbi:MAG: T9SS type A sorting domain-containing protein [Sporocytophaga sp.]|uniref:T9SS type A sorting domain-containing protein n=1 Tax=Sporocytophaga sp. TaxID=2231183 RepID=UPI001B2A01FE|nr:T9SS type A sorting domain-containing protein [Sporocytophaga sp.]MBO9700449.1 T9SS type A sorting domain-containing protein [Sporocytophaga sp.]